MPEVLDEEHGLFGPNYWACSFLYRHAYRLLARVDDGFVVVRATGEPRLGWVEGDRVDRDGMVCESSDFGPVVGIVDDGCGIAYLIRKKVTESGISLGSTSSSRVSVSLAAFICGRNASRRESKLDVGTAEVKSVPLAAPVSPPEEP